MPSSDFHAILLAGGRGTRLRPYTTALPKPLVPIGDDCAIVEVILRQLAASGFGSATIAVGHLGELVRAYVGNGTQWGIAVDYADEESPLGTMGPVVQILDRLPEHFLVMNGDILTDLNYASLLRSHVDSGAPMTIATFQRSVAIDFGVLTLEGDSVTAFQEKPVLRYTVSMGAYALSRTTLEPYVPGHPLGFDQLVLDLLNAGQTLRAYPFGGLWLDIGRPEDYDQANEMFGKWRERLLPSTPL